MRYIALIVLSISWTLGVSCTSNKEHSHDGDTHTHEDQRGHSHEDGDNHHHEQEEFAVGDSTDHVHEGVAGHP